MTNNTTMTPEDRAKLMGAELARYTDELVDAIGTKRFPDALGNFLAAALGRVTALAASAIVLYDERISEAEQRQRDSRELLGRLVQRVEVVERDLLAAHRRSDSNAGRVTQANTDIGMVSDRVHRLEDDIDRFITLAHQLAVDVEQLKERQAGSGGA